MRNFLTQVLRGLGRMIRAFFYLLWEILQEVGRGIGRLLYLILEGIGQGLAVFLRRLIPAIAGVAGFWLVFKYQPELFESLLALGIIILGIWIVIRPLRRRPRSKRGN
jgi:hypothetical protein